MTTYNSETRLQKVLVMIDKTIKDLAKTQGFDQILKHLEWRRIKFENMENKPKEGSVHHQYIIANQEACDTRIKDILEFSSILEDQDEFASLSMEKKVELMFLRIKILGK